jgi:DNA repair photolyase
MTPDLFNPSAPATPARTTMNGKPVHNVPAKSVINFTSAFSHKLLCDGLTFSTGSACAYSCSFCYVEDLMRKNPHWQGYISQKPDAKFEDVVIRREGAIAAMRSQLVGRGNVPRFNDPNDRRVIFASPLVDVAANMDLVKETVEACKVILELTNWHIRLLSKSNLLPKVAELLEDWAYNRKPEGIGYIEPKDRIIYGVSTGTLNDGLAHAIEIGTPLVSKRIASLHWLQDNGFRTYGMVCPSLPQTDYKKFATDMLNAIRADRCEHVWGEVINARGESFTRTHAALVAAGFHDEAASFARVSNDPVAWEQYARATFEAEAQCLAGTFGPDKLPKLRFLQYVTKESRAWWLNRVKDGAILL